MGDYPDMEERLRAHGEGKACRDAGGSPFDNPYHKNYPNPAKGGDKEEIMARHWVDGYCNQPPPAPQEGQG